jgi:hypothetical protein
MLWVRIPLSRSVFDTTLCDKFVSDLQQVCGILRILRFSDRHDINEILLMVVLSTIILILIIKKNKS